MPDPRPRIATKGRFVDGQDATNTHIVDVRKWLKITIISHVLTEMGTYPHLENLHEHIYFLIFFRKRMITIEYDDYVLRCFIPFHYNHNMLLSNITCT